MSSNATSAPEAGQTLAGKYLVEEVLGIGGMGVVVSARHLQLDQKVAIKYLLPAALLNPEVVERFAREARAAAKIRGEHATSPSRSSRSRQRACRHGRGSAAACSSPVAS
jgi:serine/threonine protein kinase